MRFPLWRPRTRGAVEELDWPRGVIVLSSCFPLLTGVAVLVQRHAFTSPGRTTLFVTIAILPWLLQLAGILLPRPLFAAFVLAGTLGTLLQPVENDYIAPFLLVSLATQMGALAPLIEGACWTVGAIGFIAGLDVWGPYEDAFPWYFGISLGWIGGSMVRSQVGLLTRLRAAQENLAERAAADERRRIARDLHDVIAHSLTVMMLHVTGARRALARDPRDAAAGLEEAERLGRQSLQDVRRVVGVLGASKAQEGTTMPEATDVGALLDQFGGAGLRITSEVEGRLESMSPTAGLALYRILQESLTNAAKHAPGEPLEVKIQVTADTASLRVTNPLHRQPASRTGSGSNGFGLWGMRERTSLLGGSLAAGAKDGQWVVEATIPTAGAGT